MNALPDLATYQDPEALTPPDAEECLCSQCVDVDPPRWPSPYTARRSVERIENGDPDS